MWGFVFVVEVLFPFVAVTVLAACFRTVFASSASAMRTGIPQASHNTSDCEKQCDCQDDNDGYGLHWMLVLGLMLILVGLLHYGRNYPIIRLPIWNSIVDAIHASPMV